MTYLQLKSLINDSYARFVSEYVSGETLGADDEYALKNMYFVKCIYKVLLNQEGDDLKDKLTQEQIQDCIILLNKYSNSIIAIEYS
jgi:hypothetical protein